MEREVKREKERLDKVGKFLVLQHFLLFLSFVWGTTTHII